MRKIIAPLLGGRAPFVRKFGLFQGLRIARTMFPKERVRKEVAVHIPPFRNDIHLRTNTADISTFWKVILKDEYRFECNMSPGFIIDGGANIGLTSLQFAQQFNPSLIVAIEPEQGNFELLKKNTSNYKAIEPMQGALWNKDCNLSIVNKEANTSAYVVMAATGNDYDTKASSITSILKKYNQQQLDILKLDVEGSELEIFTCGYEEWLPNTRLLIIETHDRFRPGCTEAVLKAVSKYNFSRQEKGENIFFANKDYNVVINV